MKKLLILIFLIGCSNSTEPEPCELAKSGDEVTVMGGQETCFVVEFTKEAENDRES